MSTLCAMMTRPSYRLDDTQIAWRPFHGYDGLFYWVLGVNDVRQQVDLLFRLAPGARCPSHRHVGPTDTLVLEGEHRTWGRTEDGWVLEQIRPPGYFATNEGDHLHSEEGGVGGAIVHLSMTAIDGVIWEVFDDHDVLLGVSTLDDFRRALEHQPAFALSS